MKNMGKKKIVVLGGGTGQGNLLRGLKQEEGLDLTAIVAVSDDGGGSGTIRTEMKMLPPGDIRNCLISLSNMDPTMEKLMNHRFRYGSLKNQNFGNLFLLALNEIFGDFQIAIDQVSEMIAVKGKVVPATLVEIRLISTLATGNVVIGESAIGPTCLTQQSEIEKIEIIPRNPEANPIAIKKIHEADIIVIGPGSLYTSLIPNLLIPEIRLALKESKVPKIYICNLMTENGETHHLNTYQHVQVLQEIMDCRLDYVLLNNRSISEQAKDNYRKEEKQFLYAQEEDIIKINRLGIQTIRGDFVVETEYGAIMHDSEKVSKIILSILTKGI